MAHDLFEIFCSEEEFEVLKSLAIRWLKELEAAQQSIDEDIPILMRDEAKEELGEALQKAKNICEALECQINS